MKELDLLSWNPGRGETPSTRRYEEVNRQCVRAMHRREARGVRLKCGG